MVHPSGPLSGKVAVSGAKNSALKLMAASLLAEGTFRFDNVPMNADVRVMAQTLGAIGCSVEISEPDLCVVEVPAALEPEAPYELVTRMRASINVLGPLIGRLGRARVALPGGDAIGSRKLDMHFQGLRAMGVDLSVRHGFIEAFVPHQLRGAVHTLPFPSVGATENLMTAAVLAKGTTVIENAAREPEIAQLASMLNRMGAEILGAGSPRIEIRGVDGLEPVDETVIPDRIEAGTFVMVCAIAGGEIEVIGARPNDMDMLVAKMSEMGVLIAPTTDGLWVKRTGELNGADVATLPHPGLATDFMPPLVAVLSVASGRSIVTENIFDGRFAFVDELVRMGAQIRTEGGHCIIKGVPRLSGAQVRALDVRAGAALVLAGTVADVPTTIHDPIHIDRGYVNLVDKLSGLGVKIERVSGDLLDYADF